MTFPNPFSTKTARVSKILASEINTAGTYISRAIDGTNGGAYNLLSALILGGSGVQIANGSSLTVNSGGALSLPSGSTLTSASGSTLTLDGATTASDFTMSGTNRVKVASRSITRVQPFFAYSPSATWLITFFGTAVQQANAPDTCGAPIRPPHGATLTAVTAYVIGGGGHAALPSTMPQLRVFSTTNAGVQASFGTQTDTSANVAAYEAVHTITISGLSHTVDRVNRRYHITLQGEQDGGVNYHNNFTLLNVACTYTITEYDED